jgi:hypothetical protein
MHGSERGALAMTVLQTVELNGDSHSFSNSLTQCVWLTLNQRIHPTQAFDVPSI